MLGRSLLNGTESTILLAACPKSHHLPISSKKMDNMRAFMHMKAFRSTGTIFRVRIDLSSYDDGPVGVNQRVEKSQPDSAADAILPQASERSSETESGLELAGLIETGLLTFVEDILYQLEVLAIGFRPKTAMTNRKYLPVTSYPPWSSKFSSISEYIAFIAAFLKSVAALSMPKLILFFQGW